MEFEKGQFTFDGKVSKRYMNGKIVKQRIMQNRYLKDICELCLNAP